MLAKLRRSGRKTFRYQQEQRAIEAWLRLIVQAAGLSSELAMEIAECARLIKGYGDTHKRGTGNYRLIETELILPALAGNHAGRHAAAEAIANARTAALLDPEGERFDQMPRRIAVTIGAQDRGRIGPYRDGRWARHGAGASAKSARSAWMLVAALAPPLARQRRGAGAIGVLSRVTR